MTAPHIDSTLVRALAHERRRRAALPPIDDLPITEAEALPLGWQASTTGSARLSAVLGIGESVAGTLILTIAAGWIGGQVIAAMLLAVARGMVP